MPVAHRTVLAFLMETFAAAAALSVAEIRDHDLTLAEIIARSTAMNNSLDLMEAFARTANAARQKYGVTVRLGVFPLDTPISVVLKALGEQFPGGEAQP